MKNLSTGILSAFLGLGLIASAPAAEEGIDFRKDVFARQRDGYHTYRIPVMVVTAKGTVLLFCEGRKVSRRAGGDVDLLLKRSEDGGATWSRPVVDRNLPCPACQASMVRLNEKEILFLNPAVHPEGGFHLWSRRNLTLRLSRDDGRTWPHARVLNEGLAGYSDMAVTKEGKILCVFENGTNDYCEKISIVQVDRAWLVAEQTP